MLRLLSLSWGGLFSYERGTPAAYMHGENCLLRGYPSSGKGVIFETPAGRMPLCMSYGRSMGPLPTKEISGQGCAHEECRPR